MMAINNNVARVYWASIVPTNVVAKRIAVVVAAIIGMAMATLLMRKDEETIDVIMKKHPLTPVEWIEIRCVVPRRGGSGRRDGEIIIAQERTITIEDNSNIIINNNDAMTMMIVEVEDRIANEVEERVIGMMEIETTAIMIMR